jgi:DNA-binding MarR family transcriptional regulator
MTGSYANLPAALSVWTSAILNEANQRAQKLLEHYLEPLTIRAKHYGILMLLSEEGALAQAELGRRLHVDRTTMVFLVDELEQTGLVERCRSPRDRRIHAVTITEPGKTLLTHANERLRLAEEEFMGPLSATERAQLRALLFRLT